MSAMQGLWLANNRLQFPTDIPLTQPSSGECVGRHEDKLARLGDRGIKTELANGIEWRSFERAVECTGNPEGFDLALRSLRPRGVLVLKSTYADHLTLNASAVVVDEITLIGSRCGPFDKALKLLEQASCLFNDNRKLPFAE